MHDREPDELGAIVKISRDGGFHFTQAVHEDGAVDENLAVWELPEDEFYFFQAFRPAISRLAVEAPGYLFEMALINLYALFEAYAVDVVQARFLHLPHLISARATRTAAAEAHATERARLEHSVHLDLRRMTYGSVSSLLSAMRDDLEMADLTSAFDDRIQIIAWVRNVLLHAGGMADLKLATADPAYEVGVRVQVTDRDLSIAMKRLRDVALAIDRADQAPSSRPA